MFRKIIKPTIYVLVLLIPIAIVFFKPKKFDGVFFLDHASRPVGLIQSVVFELRKIFYYHDTYDEYRKLKKQTDLLKAKIVRLQEQLQEAGRLDKIAEFRRVQSFTSIVADVIGRDPTSWNASLILDKGKSDGIKVGMPVLSPLGVVGKIIEVGYKTSKAILLSDPDFSVAAVVSRTRESGLLSGTLQGICRLHYLTDNADVKVGDKIVTSKLSASFPEDIMIGQVVDVQAALNSHTVECLVEPVVDLSQLEEVIIVK